MLGVKKRNSNIELLRVFAMLMIVAYHILAHCIGGQLNNGLFAEPVFEEKLLILQSITPMGQIGNVIFMLIAGYFMGKRTEIDLSAVSRKLLFQQGFAAVMLTLGATLVYEILRGGVDI